MGNNVVLITGASSGIGKSAAEYLMMKGFHVYGTSRKVSGSSEENIGSDLTTGGFFRMISMDVTDEASIENAINLVILKEGHVDVLVSNAGTGVAGSVEDVSIEEAYTQFDINFFGTLRVIKAMLPIMRDQGYGRIIAISSVAGVISIPYQAHYSSSKFAVEGLIEALRYEVAPFGIKVCLVEPGDTKTGFTKSRIIAQRATKESPYYEKFTKSLARMEKDEQNGASPEAVAGVIYKMIKRRIPPVRTTVGLQYKTILLMKKILPGKILEKVVGLLYN